MTKLNCLQRSLLNLDIYGKPITMTYKGKEKFKSQLGGFISMAIILFILSLFLYKVNDLVKRNQTQVKKNSLVSISNSYSPPHDISEKNITIAFKLANFYGENIPADPYYGSFVFKQFQIFQLINKTDGTSYREFNTYVVPYSKCKIGVNFHYPYESEAQMNGIETFYCPDWNNLTIQGNWNSPAYQGLTLIFQRCENNDKSKLCANDTEFDSWIRQVDVNEIIISQFFNVTDYETPIHYFLDDMFVSLVSGKSLYTSTSIQKNEVTLYDNILGLYNTATTDLFFSKSNDERFIADIEFGPGKGMYFYQDFIIDKEYDTYERKVYTIMGVLQDVGGFYNALFFLGLILYSKFQATIYFSTLITHLFKVKMSEPSLKEQNYNKRQKKHLNISNSEDSSRQQIHESASPEVFEDIESKSSRYEIKSEVQSQKTIQIENHLTRTVLDKLFKEISERSRITFTLCTLLQITFSSFICCRKRRAYNQSNSQTNVNGQLKRVYDYGEKHITKELDVVHIMKRMRILETFIQLHLSQDQRQLLSLQKKNIIDFTLENKPKALHSPRTRAQVTSSFKSQPHQQLQILQTLQKKKQLKIIDRKLLFGVFREDIDNIELQKSSMKPYIDQKIDQQVSMSLINSNMKTQSVLVKENFKAEKQTRIQKIKEIQEQSPQGLEVQLPQNTSKSQVYNLNKQLKEMKITEKENRQVQSKQDESLKVEDASMLESSRMRTTTTKQVSKILSQTKDYK